MSTLSNLTAARRRNCCSSGSTPRATRSLKVGWAKLRHLDRADAGPSRYASLRESSTPPALSTRDATDAAGRSQARWPRSALSGCILRGPG